MTASKSLPARPSLESLRKQAKKFARDIAAGDAGAIARARVRLPHADLPLTQRNAQLVIAREYGYAGWQDFTAEVSKHLGHGLNWAAAQARRVIHDNDVERLKQLLAEYPTLLSWQDDDDHGGLLGFATAAYGDAGDPERERWFTRAASAELLIDIAAVVAPSVLNGLIDSRARGLLQLFQHKGLVPHTLRFLAALGDLDAVRTALDENGNDLSAVNEAFISACRFGHETVASFLLDRSIALDPELGTHVDGSLGRTAFIFSVINRHFDVADFLLEHGADINTNWNSHEPASILHHLVMLPNPYESMRFLIDRGIDMTIKDYRWDSNAAGWARHGYNDEKMAQWLEEAERQREQGR